MLSVFSYMGSDLLLYGTYGSSTLNIPSIFGYQAFVFFFFFDGTIFMLSRLSLTIISLFMVWLLYHFR